MQKLARVLVFASCFIFMIGELSAQEIKGTVKSEEGKVVPFANVYWLNTTIGTTTDEKGEFTIPSHNQTNNLVISSVGYTSDTLKVITTPILIELKN